MDLKISSLTVFAILLLPILATADESISAEILAKVLSPDHSVMLAKVWEVRGTPQGPLIARRLIAELQSPVRERRNLAGCALKEFGPYGTGEGIAAALLSLLRRDPQGISPCAAEGAVDTNRPLPITLNEAPALLRLNPNYSQYVDEPLAALGEPLVPLLIKNLSSPDVFKKRQALGILAKMGGKAEAAKEPLRKLLHDRDNETDVIAAYALFQIDSDDQDALRTLIQSIHERRGNMYWTAKTLEKKKNLPEVQKALADAQQAQSPPPDDIPTLMGILETPTGPNDSRHLQSARKLAALMTDSKNRAPEIKVRLIALSKHKSYLMSDPAFDVLMEFKGDPDVRATFVDALHNHPDESIRGKSTGRLLVNTNRDITVLPELRKALGDPSEFVRVRAAQDLGRMGDYSGLEVLKKILSETPVHDPNPKIGSQDSDTRIGMAARAAGSILHPELLPMLKKLAALGKAAPFSSGEATRALWSTEIKYTEDHSEKLRMLQSIVQHEGGIYWAERELIYRLSDLKLTKADVIGALAEPAASKEFYTSHAAKEAIRRYEAIVKQP